MGLFRRKNKNWNMSDAGALSDKARNRDVHTTQDLERGERGVVDKPIKERVGAVFIGLLAGVLGFVVGRFFYIAKGFRQYMMENSGSFSFLDLTLDNIEVAYSWHLYAFSLFCAFVGFVVANDKLMGGWRSRNSMVDGSDINSYENDQRVMLRSEMLERFDIFPDVGAHSSVQVTSMVSHIMLDKKGLRNVDMVQRYAKDVSTENGGVHYKGAAMLNDDGSYVTKNVPMIDEAFGQDLFTASGIEVSEKDVRKPVDVRKVGYNPKDSSGARKDRDKLPYDTYADVINHDWEFPDYEVQRPAGVYLVDTAPLNTMVLAITRAGKGQTVIEPTIDMWTREKRQNNIVVNDPKGELLAKFFVPATVRGYEVIQFNLINPLNTDIYNPLGFAAESAREGDFTKAAMYIENIGDVFFPKEGADDPMWPNAANNAFKRSAYGMIAFYLEEENRLRKQAERKGTSEKILSQQLDDLWGKVTLYNAYQFFVVLSAKKSTDLSIIKLDEDENVKEKDFLTLFFDASAKLPQNEMRKMVQNTDNALRTMAGSDKTIASVYGIALTAMSFFTDPTISTLTSGKPSQNFDAKGLSFPRRAGVRFASEYLERYRFVGLQAVWTAYEDAMFTKQLDTKLFGHSQIIDRDGWARYFFDGKFGKRTNYVKLEVKNPTTGLLVKSFHFELELMYKTDLSGKRYVKDPVTNVKVIRDGVLRELRFNKKKDSFEYKDSMVKRRYYDLLNPEQGERMVDIPVFRQKSVKYSERAKAVFFITPPHLMSYAKLILILIKQMVDVNFESSYMTKEDQKPLYKTRYMLDEVGNLQSEGKGIPGLQTMLSIGLGQDQQFTLILQTLQQLRDVYGDSVDKIVQGNLENIVFLKSTDDSMIETLVKMSGVTHESRVDQKTITKDNEKLLSKTEGRISYTMSTKERPVISFNDFMFIEPRNSIILKAGSSPIWNRKETAYPMSYRLLQNKIKIPGRDFGLQTLPTNSSARDFDVRKNQPDFFKMLERLLEQARMTESMTMSYLSAYGLTETELLRLDPNVVSEDIMDAINTRLDYMEEYRENPELQGITEEEIQMMDEFGDMLEHAVDNKELAAEAAKSQQQMSTHQMKRYAGGHISRDNLVSMGGAVNRQLDNVLALAYADSMVYFEDAPGFRTTDDGELFSDTGVLYVRTNKGANRHDFEILEESETDASSRVYGDDGDTNDTFYEVTNEFIAYLATLESWKDLAGGRFEQEASRAYQLKMA